MPQVVAIVLVEAQLYCNVLYFMLPQNTVNAKIEINELNVNKVRTYKVKANKVFDI